MADDDKTPFEYLSIEPYGLLDSIAAGFEGGLHPELRRLMHECKAAALKLQSKNILNFPLQQNIAGSAPVKPVNPTQMHSGNVTMIDFGGSPAKAPTKTVGKK